MTPATILGTYAGKRLFTRMSEQFFITLVEIGLVTAGVLFLIGI